MKKYILFFMVSFVTIACNQKPSNIITDEGLIIKVNIEELDSKETPESILDILKSRIQNKYADYKTNIVYNGISQTYVIELPYISEAESEQAHLLLSSKGKFDIYETVLQDQIIYSDFVDSVFCTNDTLSLLRSVDDYSIIGAATASDTSKISDLLRTGRSRLPISQDPNFHFRWGHPLPSYYNELQGLYPLYCVKKASLGFILNNACKKIEISEYAYNTPEEIYNNFIHISLKTEYAQKFEKLTKQSIGYPLIISLDNTVISVPIVQNYITSGNMAISGAFTYEHLKTFESILKYEIIETPLTIASIRKTKNAQQAN